MIQQSQLRFGLVGAGGIANAYSTALRSSNYAKLTAVADTNIEAATRLAKQHDAAIVGSVEQLGDRDDVDAVIVCTPPLYHPQHCIELINRGKHVLCEKPLAIDSTSARDMLQAAKENDTIFTMASKFRFVDDIREAKRMLDDAVLGDIVLYENCFTGIVDMSQRWNADPQISGGGVLIDNGTHSLDIMRYFLGHLSEIRVVEGLRIQQLPVEDTVHVFARSASGTIGSIDLSWSLHKDVPYFVSLYGTLGTVQVGWSGSRFKLRGEKDWTNFGTGYDKIASFSGQLDNFAGAILTDTPLVIGPSDALASVHAVEAAYSAMDGGVWTPVPSERRHTSSST